MACCVGDGFDLFFSLKYTSLQINRLITLAEHTRDGESLIHKLNKAAFKKKIKGVCWGESLLCEIFHWVLSKAIQHMGNTLRTPLERQGLTKRAGELLPHLN